MDTHYDILWISKKMLYKKGLAVVGFRTSLNMSFSCPRLGMDFLAFFSSEKKVFHFMLTKQLVVAIVLVIGSFGFYPIFGQEQQEHNPPVEFGIHGHALIKAYHSDGTLYRIWEGDNSLSTTAINAIVSCATGVSTAPYGYGKCNSWMTAIEIAEIVQQQQQQQPNRNALFNANTTVTNHLIPQTCNPNSPNLSRCTGWQSQATFNDEITQQASINSVRGFDGSNGYPFDSLIVDAPIQVRPGDTLDVTITFTALSS